MLSSTYLDQEHLPASNFRQTVGQNGADSTSSNDDEVIGVASDFGGIGIEGAERRGGEEGECDEG